tara:strand:+ start:2140 stop:2349 length:210 start_codon:yes stop_codon:yes gene_type:complete
MTEKAFDILKTGVSIADKAVERAGGSVENTVRAFSAKGGGGPTITTMEATNSVQPTPETGKGSKLNGSA